MSQEHNGFTEQVLLRLTVSQKDAYNDETRKEIRNYLDGKTVLERNPQPYRDIGLMEAIHNSDSYDFSEIIYSASTLAIYGTQLEQFFSFRSHLPTMIGRFSRDDCRSLVIFGKQENDNFYSHSHSYKYKLSLNTLINPDCHTVMDLDDLNNKLPYFLIIADKHAFFPPSPHHVGNNILLHWCDTDINSPAYALKMELNLAMHRAS